MDLGAKIRRGGKTDVSLLENYVSNLEFLLQRDKMTAAEVPFGVSAAVILIVFYVIRRKWGLM